NRGDHRRAAQGNGAGARVKEDDIIVAGTRALGKYKDGLSTLQGRDGMINDLGRTIVGDVAASAYGTVQEGIVQQTELDDAVGLPGMRKHENHIEQRGMVGDNDLSGAAQPVLVGKAVIE